MSPIAIVAFGAVSPLGHGEQAFAVGAVGEVPATCVERDATLERAGLARPLAARAPFETRAPNRAGALLGCAAEMLAQNLDRELPGWRTLRLVAVRWKLRGRHAEPRARARGEGSLGGARPPRSLAARSMTGRFLRSARGSTRRWSKCLRPALRPRCDGARRALARIRRCGPRDCGRLRRLVVRCVRFEALGTTTASALAPFRFARDGMALGEGAALVALVRPTTLPNPLGDVQGFGATSDAVHVTAPDPEVAGWLGPPRWRSPTRYSADDIDLVSAHATATLHNDAAEAVPSDTLSAQRLPPVLHAFKAVTGHCLGAAGTLETLAALAAVRGFFRQRRARRARAALFGRVLSRHEAGTRELA